MKEAYQSPLCAAVWLQHGASIAQSSAIDIAEITLFIEGAGGSPADIGIEGLGYENL